MIPFRDQVVEYYASGQFFKNLYATTGEAVAKRAQAGDEDALHGAAGRMLAMLISFPLSLSRPGAP
jgi:hypothetical protein